MSGQDPVIRPTSVAEGEHIVLDVPAATEHLRLVRLLVASLATSHGADLNDLEDLRIAAGEVCAHVIGPADETDRLVAEASVRLTDEGVELLVRASVTGLADPGPFDELSAMVLDAAADDHGVDSDPVGSSAWFTRTVHSVEPTDLPVD